MSLGMFSNPSANQNLGNPPPIQPPLTRRKQYEISMMEQEVPKQTAVEPYTIPISCMSCYQFLYIILMCGLLAALGTTASGMWMIKFYIQCKNLPSGHADLPSDCPSS